MVLPGRIAVKRVYDSPTASDGVRILVDRLWPRGLSKVGAHIDLWLRDLAPSNELRKWFHAHPEYWKEFRHRYLSELRTPEAEDALKQLQDAIKSREGAHPAVCVKEHRPNNATLLKEFVAGMKKTRGAKSKRPLPANTKMKPKPKKQTRA